MRTYSHTIKTATLNSQDVVTAVPPIVETHWYRTSDHYAEQATATAFGKNYVAPEDRDFKDHEPGERRSVKHHPETWYSGGAVAADILRGLIHQEEDGEAA